VTINMADDEELLALAAKAGCAGVFIGFESPTAEGLKEVGGKFNMLNGRDFAASVRRIQRHKILVAGSFIVGLDTDEPGIGRRIADAAIRYGVDTLNTLFLTPLPGTRLWDEMESQRRLAANSFPEDWKYYTLTFPVAQYRHLSCREIVGEMEACDGTFYAVRPIVRRVWRSIRHWRQPLIALVANLSYRNNMNLSRASCSAFMASHGLLQGGLSGSEATGSAFPEECRDQEIAGQWKTRHGLSHPMSAISHDSK
jgi:radical SAM superfamily enzyme YgiQ (UPF0313 family)